MLQLVSQQKQKPYIFKVSVFNEKGTAGGAELSSEAAHGVEPLRWSAARGSESFSYIIHSSSGCYVSGRHFLFRLLGMKIQYWC